MKDIYKKRREKLSEWMAKEGVGAVFFHDSEASRTPAVRYFSGMPNDSIYMQALDGSNVLCSWDESMAHKMAQVDSILAYTNFERSPIKAAAGLLKHLKVPKNSKVELPSTVSYPLFLQYVHDLSDYNVVCRDDGATQFVEKMRAIKDEYEIECIRKASKITDAIIDLIEQGVKDETIKTETDVALLIERECRKEGCEKTGFDTLAAGPSRSYGIHCFPPYTAALWPDNGLSILDFGVVYEGYTSDITLTVAKGPLTGEQEKQLELVEKAYKAALPLYKAGASIFAAGAIVDKIFAKEKRTMPHSLGHGYGLQAHEWPTVRTKMDKSIVFEPGMVLTCEPGLYDPEIGGCRLENDILIKEDGVEILTHSRIIRI